MTKLSLGLLATILTTSAVMAANPVLPVFDAAAFSAPKENPWFPLATGTKAVLAGDGAETADDAADEKAASAEVADDEGGAEADEKAASAEAADDEGGAEADEKAGSAETADDELDKDASSAETADDAADDDADSAKANEDTTQDAEVRFSVTGPGPVVLGVQTVQLLDEEWLNGHVTEKTVDLVATDNAGNVWYFGEDVTNYTYDAKGNLTGTATDASWRAGEAGALPGILLPGTPKVGDAMFIGQAPAAHEMSYWEVLSVDASVKGPAGNFTGVLQLRQGSTLEPDDREVAFYAPGLGLVREETGLSPALDNPTYIGERQP